MNGLGEYLAARRRLVDLALDRYLPPADREPRAIHRCMRYSVGGGKRLRPIVAMAVAEMLSCPAEKVIPTCAAVELIHTHSLILDDMPCMDNDDWRRGRLTSHRKFGEAIALLAADALLNLAITLLATNHRLADVSPETALEIIREVGASVGTDGVIGGQLADLSYECGGDDAGTLECIHLAKTADLFRLAARAAALVAGAPPDQVERVASYAENLGLAFQIVDDLLDHNSVPAPTGAEGRTEPNYASARGITEAQQLAARATGNALVALSCFAQEAEPLRLLARYNLARDS